MDAGMLRAIAAARLYGDSEWHGIPLLGLAGDSPPTGIRADDKPCHETQIRRLQNVLDSYRCDSILCQYGTVAVLFRDVLAAARPKLFIHVHGRDTQEHMHPPEYRTAFESLAARATIICSPYVREVLSHWKIPKASIIVKNYGVEIPDRPKSHSPSSAIAILHLGRLIDCKAPDRTIQAFELACDRGLTGRLIMIGDGPLRCACEKLRAKSAWRDRIAILGFVSDEEARRAFNEADVFTQHSMRGDITGQVEAFGVSVVEAMAMGLPVVSCPVGGIRYTVVDGETGILTPAGDVAAQASAFLKLAGDPRLRAAMGRCGWERSRAYYSYEAERDCLIEALNH